MMTNQVLQDQIIGQKVEAMLAGMNLAQKIGQMTMSVYRWLLSCETGLRQVGPETR